MKDLYVFRNPLAAARALGTETIVMNPEDSTFFTLNAVGSIIWRNADGRSTLGQIVDHAVCAEFDVTPARALADAELFAAALCRGGVLRSSPSPVV
ncbi:MAG: PqqD family protein [Bryobacteraceae bacterium]